MRATLSIFILLATLGLSALGQADERQLAKLEADVQAANAAREETLEALRAHYMRLERELALPLSEAQRAVWVAELARVLEDPLRAASAAVGGREAATRRALQGLLEAVPQATKKLERAPLTELAEPVAAKVVEVLRAEKDLAAIAALGVTGLSERALAPIIDSSRTFAARWNDHLAPHDATAQAYAQAFAAHKAADEALLVAKDPSMQWRIGAPDGFARVPAGDYLQLNTSGFAATSGQRKQEVRFQLPRDVYIGIYEVTVAEWLAWLDTLSQSERAAHRPRGERDAEMWPLDEILGEPRPLKEMLRHPIRGISLSSAMAFARAQGARLPTELEWCAMAGGPIRGGRARWPWVFGERYTKNFCNNSDQGVGDVMEVGSFPQSRGPFGHHDIAGNVAEWTMTYESGKEIDPLAIEDAAAVVRGGGFRQGADGVQVGWVWFRRALFEKDVATGFRLARDAKP